MISNINFLLIGNSRLHWATKEESQYKFFHTDKDYKIPKDFDTNQLIWASVGEVPNLLLQSKNEIKTKDINLRNLPDYFGVDRAFACLAAIRTIENPLKKDLLIADCGTILSLTKITAEGSIIGGQLVPGFLTQLKSIEKFTKNLKTPKKYNIPAQEFLLNTEDAILKGVTNSLIGMINYSSNSDKDIVIICGGDSQLIFRILKGNSKKVIYAPDLVMQGMI